MLFFNKKRYILVLIQMKQNFLNCRFSFNITIDFDNNNTIPEMIISY